ncbi:tRNA (adenosine(37)-N6)-threonylcarbamoyltransferase complex dimerization subunit type 1 TsaB [Bartonella henselae]|uniref:tRNA (adenosine(37)-N6)-threonylcarbamoyltransferase complex dimerization subunit type 1 TsaB n=1 Tax=Bartonella henselae TaxID=38323 RepID=UPI00095A4FF5|nr:tRNA (adenosine(37)-N6)-threonylcarbamoyltransferase complex dimerization subunit type 1 TsaB [Bartonella henselae]OLL56098.1 tRNA threonylcarbamoyladenosine biosynthesis protein TsaB [Bartonella henselae]OLL56735.1 tRNA threonylcarbamoyladenosine biosynthesis protein TsaB [Bartonella henselae]UJM32633.1 tRNA (adenosine(37)-N6)-threonylcarbamoyltransferase complex dimerization subunit type 1 TsaB [Bartonella henselae]
MLILALDTASIYCAVALIHQKSVIARISERMNKGHAEKLIGYIAQVTNQANTTLDQVDRIAVNIGPGSFTGVRVGVSTARALSLALEIPAVGVSALEALAMQVSNNNTGLAITVVIEAGRDMFYHQNFSEDLIPLGAPGLKTIENIIEDLPQQTRLTGPAADIIALHIKNNKINKKILRDKTVCEAADIVNYAHLAAKKQTQDHPRPLYLRSADAKQQTDFALPRKK